MHVSWNGFSSTKLECSLISVMQNCIKKLFIFKHLVYHYVKKCILHTKLKKQFEVK
jgi:hypothetical protein